MKKCSFCGAESTDDAIFCNECGKKFETTSGEVSFKDLAKSAGDAVSKAAAAGASTLKEKASTASRDIQQEMNDNRNFAVKLADGEIPIREYTVTKVFIFRTPGKLLITNKRVIFYASSSISKCVLTTPIDTVGSVNMFAGLSLKPAFITLGIICFLTRIGVNDIVRYVGGLGPTLVILGIVFTILGIRKGFFMSVAAQNSSVGMVVGKSNTIGASFYAIDGVAGPDSSVVMNEIGALVLDLQQFGDNAISKWKNI